MYPPVSIVITSYNRANMLKRCIDSLLRLDYPKYEIVIVNDGSTDNTKKMLKLYKNKVHVINHKTNKGTGAGKTSGILAAKNDLVALIDDDCIVHRDWLKVLVENLIKNMDDKVAAVTTIGIYTGHSICYLKKIVIKAGLFDESFSMAFREDTDLAFRILDLGYKIMYIRGEKFIHDPPLPKTLEQKIKFIKRRLLVHQMDCLLFKKHPKRTKEFLNVKYRIVSPFKDFKNATGLWRGKRSWEISSPQGIILLKGNNLTKYIIFLSGVLYAILLKFVRLYGSIKFDTFLV